MTSPRLSQIPTEAPWKEDSRAPTFHSLRGPLQTDVCIVGGGLTGATAAYLLAKEGYRVVLIEKDRIGHGATEYTTAFLTEHIDTAADDLVKMFGEKKAREIFRSHREAIDMIEDIVTKENIGCAFSRCPHFIYAHTEKEGKRLMEEVRVAKKLGLKIEMGDSPASPKTASRGGSLGFKHKAYAILHDQATFHPFRYLFALAETAEKHGVRLFEHTRALSFDLGKQVTVQTENGSIHAKHLVIATYEPFTKPFSLYFKKAFYTSYMLEARFPKGYLPIGIYEGADNPYHYFRIDPFDEYDRMIIGGEDHRSDIPVNKSKNWKALAAYMQERFPDAGFKLVRKWNGPILESVDGLAYIGTWMDKRVFATMAFSGNGMTYMMLAGMMLREYLLGKKVPFRDIYDPERVPGLKALFIKGRDYAQEFINGAVKNSVRRSRTRLKR